jgi:hypothetical protein
VSLVSPYQMLNQVMSISVISRTFHSVFEPVGCWCQVLTSASPVGVRRPSDDASV